MIARSGEAPNKMMHMMEVAETIIAPLIQLESACAEGETIAFTRYVGLYDSLVGNTGRKCEAMLNENRSSWKDGLLSLQWYLN